MGDLLILRHSPSTFVQQATRQRAMKYLSLFVMLSATGLSAQNVVYIPAVTEGTLASKAINTSLPVGSVAVSAGVSPTGGASYSVPITLPEACNGFQPTLGLTYNSHGGDGLLGMGWSMSGVSAITRVGADHYHDDIFDPIKYTSDDYFALDGQRLVPSNGLPYGSTNAEYDTEKAQFLSVKVPSFIDGEPGHFRIVNKAGIISYYGLYNGVTDGKVTNVSAGNKVTTWLLTHSVDPFGNTIRYNYHLDENEPRLYSIAYDISGSTGSHQALVLFTYSTRSDVNVRFADRNMFSATRLLTKIELLSTTGGTRSVKLDYARRALGRSYLTELKEYGTDGVPLNSTIFKYGEEAEAQTWNTSEISTFQGQNVDLFAGDYDGNGVSDVMAMQWEYIPDTDTKRCLNFSVYLNGSTTDSYDQQLPQTYYGLFQSQIQHTHRTFNTSDVDGDGRDDIVIANIQLDTDHNKYRLIGLQVFQSTCIDGIPDFEVMNVANPQVPFIWFLPEKFDRVHVGDFNGDGRAEVAFFGFDVDWNYLKASMWDIEDGWAAPITAGNAFSLALRINPIDINGDGQTELQLRFPFSGSTIARLAPNEDAWVTLSSSTGPSFLTELDFDEFDLAIGDFNGDGNQDALYRSTTIFYLYISDGFKFRSAQILTIDGGYQTNNSRIAVGDFNGDGRSDIFHGRTYGTAGTQGKIAYSKGMSTTGVEFEWHTNPYNAFFTNLGTGDFNGDGRTDLINQHYYNDPIDLITFGAYEQERLLQTVKDGLLNATRFAYGTMQDPDVYTDGPQLFPYPMGDMDLPLTLVKQVVVPDGNGGTNATRYIYSDAFGWRNGGGFNGFRELETRSAGSDLGTVTSFDLQPGVSGLFPGLTKTYDLSTGQLLRTSVAWNGMSLLGNQMRWHRDMVLSTFDTDELAGVTTTTHFIHDANSGNLSSSTTTIPGILEKLVTYDFGVYGPLFPFGYEAHLEKLTTTTTRNGAPTLVDEKEWEYAYITGALKIERQFANTSAPVVHEIVTRIASGRITRDQLFHTGMSVEDYAVKDYTHDQFHPGPLSTTQHWNAPGGAQIVVERGLRRPFNEGPDHTTGSDGLKMQYRYDGFGRTTAVSAPSPDEQIRYWIHTRRVWDATSVNGALYYVEVDDPGAPKVREYFDALGRSVEKWGLSFNGQWSRSRTEYDGRGRLFRTSEPALDGETAHWTVFSYDDLDRLESTTHTLSGTTNIDYDYSAGDLTTTTTLSSGRWSSTTTDASGLTVSSQDEGGKLIYRYNSHGQLVKVSKGEINLVTNVYDAWGHQTSLEDGSAGTTLYTYDPLGRLKEQVSANGGSKTFAYDNLGRLVRTEEPEGTVKLTYQLEGYFSSDRVVREEGFGVVRFYTYNELGLLQEQDMQTQQGSSILRTFKYDTYDRLAKTDYGGLVQITRDYQYGHLYGVTDVTGNTNLWKGVRMDGRGHYTQHYKLDGVAFATYEGDYLLNTSTANVFDMRYRWDYNNGDLIERWNYFNRRKESFEYDALDRLSQSKVARVNGAGQEQEQLSLTKYAYDGEMGATHGNLTRKDDVGLQAYYDAHALTGVVNGNWPGDNTSPPALISQQAQEVRYTSYHQPLRIVETVGDHDLKLLFEYGPNHQRVHSLLDDATNGTTEFRLFDGDYERQRDITGVTNEIIYVQGGAGLCAMIVISDGGVRRYAVHTDHLGSIVLLTSTNGVEVQSVAEQSFDAWGRPRNPTTWGFNEMPVLPTWIYRGYTGHEHLHPFALINMNGRVYDPVNGRMLSADNYAQGALGTQGYNRYSYAGNNPLRFTDPSGEVLWVPIMIGAAIGSAVGWQAGVRNGAEGDQLFAYALGGALIGGGAGLASGAVISAGGSLVLSGAIGGAIGNAGFNALARGTPISIATSAITGFASGALGGAVGGAIGGGAGALLGGASGAGSNVLLNGGNLDEAGRAALVGGLSSFGLYHLSGAIGYSSYKRSGLRFEGHQLSYRQFMGIGADFQRARFWHREHGGLLMENGSIDRGAVYKRHPDFIEWDQEAVLNDTWGTYHAHWARAGNPAPGGGFYMDYHSPQDFTGAISEHFGSLVINRFDASYKPPFANSSNQLQYPSIAFPRGMQFPTFPW